MVVRHINKNGHVWEYITVREANQHMKKGWRERAYHVEHPTGDWLEFSDMEEGEDVNIQVQFATSR